MARGFLRGRAPWVLAGALGASVLISGGAVKRYWGCRQELKRLEARRLETRRRLQAVEARRARAEHDDLFVETVARRELGLVRPDEIEFRFADAPPASDRSR